MKKSKKIISDLNQIERREFLILATSVLSLPFISKEISLKCLDVLSPEAHAQLINNKINFLEVNFRDQWDFGHVFLAPSLAQNADTLRSRRNLAYYDQQSDILQGPNNLWVTLQGAPLIPHLDDIAVMELGEACIGKIHAHEAGNALRSPGRSFDRRAGTKDMATVDLRPGNRSGGNEVLYSSSPTPAVLHNYFAKQQGQTRNGIILRSSIRDNIHTFYHFEGSLQNAQLDRFYNKSTFLAAFSNVQNQNSVDRNLLTRHGNRLAELLKFVDSRFFDRKPSQQANSSSHNRMLEEWGAVAQNAGNSNLTLDLTPQELNYWTNNVPSQKKCPGDSANNCSDVSGKINLGELYAWTSKLFSNNIIQTAAIDFDFHDVHGFRNRFVLETQAKNTAEPLARFITQMKQAGVWDKTLIAMYTLDGSRGPNSNSTGYGTKNAVILAGGMIRGGYYGDIVYNGGWEWKRPDDNGNPVAQGTTHRSDMRVAGADVYKTVAQAAGISSTLVNSFPDIQNGRVLQYMLK